MVSVKELVEKYERYSDEELIEINANIHNYSAEANDALAIVVNNKGE